MTMCSLMGFMVGVSTRDCEGGRWLVGWGLVGAAGKRNVRMGRIGWGGLDGWGVCMEGCFFLGGGMWYGLYDRRWQSDRAVVELGDTTKFAGC